MAESFKNRLVEKYLHGATNKRISKRLRVTMERIIRERLEALVKEKPNCDSTTMLGIDGHTIGKECRGNIRRL